MFFNISFPEPNDPDQKVLVQKTVLRQCILCLFDSVGSTLYSYEDLVGHDEALMRASRTLDPSATYQRACDEYERLFKLRHARIPTTATALRMVLLNDLNERHPNISETGFDIGIALAPSTESGRLLDGAAAIYGIFPREKPGQPAASTGWPISFDAPPCLISITVEQTWSCFWGMVASGVADILRSKGVELIVNQNERSVSGRRKDALTAVLRSLPLMPLFINDSNKHLFLCHALNALGEWGATKVGDQSKSSLALGMETTVTQGKDESVTMRPSPFLQHD